MSALEKSLFQLKFTAKTLQRQAKKANKDETVEKNKLKSALEKGNTDIAKIHAANCIRKKTEGLNLLRLASRLDAVSSRLESAITMRQVTGSLGSVVKGMDKAMQSMNLEQIQNVMDKFEAQFENVDVQTSIMEGAMSDSTAVSAPQDQIDNLINQVADEAGLEREHGLGEASVPTKELQQPVAEAQGSVREEDTALAQRLRALRPAT
ncbi:Snf7 family [Dioszegia hungarica]|uniref:Snf7 family n=1 Tax=Dioszegia hungarica TaxID=4972 RepID=A0AA38LRK5_9TREE|nr:Snf7 family [Dioszegia hungarica]KAI9633165.1 Snf7 family [Dioszegia hungarica]